MRRFTLMVILILGIICGAEAQKSNTQPTKGIKFSETTVWKKIVKKAKKEKKLIFIDSYASWCFPCKKLAYKIFTQDSVGEYFNKHFINVKYDMEQDPDGKILKKRYDVCVYPTLLFINPETEEIEHRLAGAGEADWLLNGARTASNTQRNYRAMESRYNAGERNKVFLSEYMKVLADAYIPEKLEIVTNQYLETLTEEELVSKENWELIKTNLKDPLSPVFDRLYNHKKEFYKFADQHLVDTKINFLLLNTPMMLVNKYSHKMVFDNARFNAMKDCLMKYDSPACPGGLAYLYTLEYLRKKDFKGMLAKMEEVMTYNLFRNGGFTHYIQAFIKTLKNCDDQATVQAGLSLLDKIENSSDDNILKIGLYSCKAELQQKLGDATGAAHSKAERDRLFKESQEESK